MTFAAALVQLGLLTSQTTNFTFTSDELTLALQTAWLDTNVCKTVWDSSTSFTTTTWQYPIPATVTNVREVWYQRSTTDFPEPLSRDMYDIVAGNIQFNVNARRWLSDTTTLYVKGVYKLALTDSLTTDGLVNYTLSLAALILLRQLVLKHTFVFLRNDTSMSDIINAKRDMQADVLRYKQALVREFELS